MLTKTFFPLLFSLVFLCGCGKKRDEKKEDKNLSSRVTPKVYSSIKDTLNLPYTFRFPQKADTIINPVQRIFHRADTASPYNAMFIKKITDFYPEHHDFHHFSNNEKGIFIGLWVLPDGYRVMGFLNEYDMDYPELRLVFELFDKNNNCTDQLFAASQANGEDCLRERYFTFNNKMELIITNIYICYTPSNNNHASRKILSKSQTTDKIKIEHGKFLRQN